MSNSIVQYVLLRSDLLKEMGWSIGALVAQACHASTAVLHLYKDDAHTVEYLNDLDNMHKVILEVPNEAALKKVAEKLSENTIAHKLWIEQPEDIPTCLAIKPYPKEEVKKYVGKFKLYKTTLESVDISRITVIECDIKNENSIKEVTRRARVLMNMTGPYTVLGDSVVKACIETGTHYVDITAELPFMLDMYRKYHKAAEDANVLIVLACGYACVPVATGLKYLEDNFTGKLHSVECYNLLDFPSRALWPLPCRDHCLVHYGTWESMVHVFRNLKEYLKLKKQTFPEPDPLPEEMKKSFFHRRNGRFWVPYPGPDKDVVEMAQIYEKEKKEKSSYHFRIYTTFPSLFHLILVVPAMLVYYYLSYFEWFAKLLWKYPKFFSLGYFSHKGPSEKMSEELKYEFKMIGKGWSAKDGDLKSPLNTFMTAKVYGSDPGYKTTSVAIVFSAVTIVKDKEKIPRGGVLTCGASFRDTQLLNRLIKNNTIKYEIKITG